MTFSRRPLLYIRAANRTTQRAPTVAISTGTVFATTSAAATTHDGRENMGTCRGLDAVTVPPKDLTPGYKAVHPATKNARPAAISTRIATATRYAAAMEEGGRQSRDTTPIWGAATIQSTWSLLTVNGLHVRNTHAAVRTTIVARFLVTPFALKATRTLVVKRAVAKVGPMVFTPRAAREMPLLLHPPHFHLPHFHLRLRIQNNGLPQTPPRLQLLQLSKSNTSKRVAVATTAH